MEIIGETAYAHVSDIFNDKEAPIILRLFDAEYFRKKFGRYGSSAFDIVTKRVVIGYRKIDKVNILTFRQKIDSRKETVSDYDENFNEAKRVIWDEIAGLRVIEAGLSGLREKPLTLENYAT